MKPGGELNFCDGPRRQPRDNPHGLGAIEC